MQSIFLRRVLLALLAIFSYTGVSALNLSPIKHSIDGIYQLAKRQTPTHADAFTFHLVDGDEETFTIRDSEHQQGITVECTTVSACARGFYTYVSSRALKRTGH